MTMKLKKTLLFGIKLHCSMLAEDAVKSAIEDFNKKKEEKNKN